MQLPDVLFVLMGACLAIVVAVLIYAVIKRRKIDGEGNRPLLITVIVSAAVLLVSGVGYVVSAST